MTSPYSIDAYIIDHGWIEGDINGFRFQAKLYDTGSKFGVNKGRVSKLVVWDSQKNQACKGSSGYIVDYDRGWSLKPATDKHRKLLRALLKYLEGFPASEHWEKLKKQKGAQR